MTVTPARARGVLDPATGALLATTEWGLTWIGADGERVDATPEHGVSCAAAGGGAVAVAGEGQLTWTCPGDRDGDGDGATAPLVLATPPLHRVAVAGPLIAGVTVDGDVAVWPDVGNHPPAHLSVHLEPDGVALDAARGRVAVWGWRPDGRAALVLAELLGPGLIGVAPDRPWPEPAVGAAFPLLDGAVVVGAPGVVRAVASTGTPLRRIPLPGLEAVAACEATMAWLRTPAAGGAARVGWAVLDGARVVERPLPGSDPIHMQLAVTADRVVVLVEGLAPDRLVVHRSTPDGWAEPEPIKLDS